jgi:DNA-binding LacI/PurR family transcriptional regulator
MARVTLQTIADDLGVSRTTVSNAFSRPDQLTDELRQRILDHAERLGYGGPDAAARMLRRGSTGALGLLFTEALPYAFEDPYIVGLLQGIADATQQAGVGLLIVPVASGQEHDAVRNALVDGFCVFGMPADHPAVAEARRRGIPIVFIDEALDDDRPFIGIDDRAAARAAAAHVLDLGHRRLAILSMRLRHDGREGPVDPARMGHPSLRITRDRIAGYLDAVAEAGLDATAVPVIEAARSDRDRGRRLAGALLDGEHPPTVVLALADQLALGALDAAADRGIDVPGGLSVVGFDDVPDAALAGLTTVRQPIRAKGREAGRLLLSGDDAPRDRVLLPTELVVRATTAPPRA